ncbi:MAG: hypothetical protein M3R53_00705 [Candidatus Eremiobacteraeota bacterium]|nr:hypothetical protein [Candidatus Eremiobacteraeota bacterium]
MRVKSLTDARGGYTQQSAFDITHDRGDITLNVRCDEEFIGSTELARAVASTLERAATHPITVRREKGEDVTLVRRQTWLRARRAEELEHIVLSVAHAAIERLACRSASYPAEMYWLAWLHDEDYLEFCEEFMQKVRDLIAGQAAPSALDDMAHAWEQTAFAMRDPHLTGRFSEARRVVDEWRHLPARTALRGRR